MRNNFSRIFTYFTASVAASTFERRSGGSDVQMLAKFAEDDRIEQMNAQKRRMKQLEHQRAVERMLEERRKQFAARQVS